MATLGRQNAEGFLDDLKRYRMQVDYEPTGYLHVAVQNVSFQLNLDHT